MPGPVVPLPPRIPHPPPFLIWGLGCGVRCPEEVLCLGGSLLLCTRQTANSQSKGGGVRDSGSKAT